MNAATHRIQLSFDPHNSVFPWDWNVYELAGGRWLASGYGKTQAEAEAQAREYVARETAETPAPLTLYVDPNGENGIAVQG